MNLDATHTYNFVLFSHLLCIPHTQHFWNCWSDLFWSPWERERDPFMVKLRSWGNLIQEQPKSKQQGTLHYEIHMRILLLTSNHIMTLWKEFIPPLYYSQQLYMAPKVSNTLSYFTWTHAHHAQIYVGIITTRLIILLVSEWMNEWGGRPLFSHKKQSHQGKLYIVVALFWVRW
jgi:hypothetical protein